MGKTRKPKIRSKVNPLGIPSLREIERNEDAFFDAEDSYPGGPIQAIHDQLQSASTEEKMNALQSLATLSLNAEKVKLICTSDIIRIIGPLLVDKNLSIRNATAGAIRNLSINGVTVCETLVEQDILTPLLVLLTEYANIQDWIPNIDHTMKNQLDEKSDTFLHAINILWNLCESTSIALDNFNQSQLLPSFIRCLNYKIFGIEISIAVAQCLLVISEDNPNSWNILSNYVIDIVNILTIDESTESESLLRTLAAGILSNIPALCAAYSNQILLAISKTLDINHRLNLGQLTSKLPLNGIEEYHEMNNDDNRSINNDDNNSIIMENEETEEEASRRRRRQDLPSELEIEIRKIGYLLQAQRIAAETITNLCTTDDDNLMDIKDGNDDNYDNNDEIESENESVHDYDVNNHSGGGSSTNLQNSDKLPIEILEAIKSYGLIEKLWLKAQPIPENVYEILKQTNSNEILNKIKNLRVTTLLCLQNLCNIINTEDLGGQDALYGVWLDLGQQVFQGQQKDQLIIEAITSLMRSALEHLKLSSKHFQQMTENDLQLMLNGIENCTISEIRSNWLRMLGILGSLLSENLVKYIIKFILDICLNENDVWTLSEGIDALMDIFADNDWNQIVYELNIQQKSKQLQKLLKTKIRQQKRDLKERYHAVLTVQNNLQRFTKYIENQMRTYKP